MSTPLPAETVEKLLRAGVRVPPELCAEEDLHDLLPPCYSDPDFLAAVREAAKHGAMVRMSGQVLGIR